MKFIGDFLQSKPVCKHIPTHRLSQPYVSSEGRPETVRGGIIKGLGQTIWLVHGDEEKLTHYGQQKKLTLVK